MVAHIVDQQCTHNSIGKLLVENFDWLPVVCATISSSEHLIAEHRCCGSGRRDGERHISTLGTGKDATPLLEAFGQRIIWTLRHHERVAQMHDATVIGLDGQRMHGHHLANAREKLQILAPARSIQEIPLHSLVHLVLDDVCIRRSGQVVEGHLVIAVRGSEPTSQFTALSGGGY